MKGAGVIHERLRARIDAKEPIVGGWVAASGEFGVSVFREAGCDFVCLDCQHSSLDEAQAAAILARSHGPLPMFVRVSANDPALIGRVADAGADGVIVPMVNSPEDAARAVDAVHYPPAGRRSFGPIREELRSMSPAALAARVMVLPMIETAEGLQAVEAICLVAGIAGVYVGPADLAISLGLDPREGATTDLLLDEVGRVTAACQDAGVIAGMHQPDATAARKWIVRGLQLVTLGTDVSFFKSSVAQGVASVRTWDTNG